MGTPIQLGGGLQDITAQGLDAFLRTRASQLQRRQQEERERAATAQEELQTRQLDIAERQNNLREFLELAAIGEPGTAVGDRPELAELAGTLGIDPSLVPRPEGLQDVLENQAISALQAMPESLRQGTFGEITDRIINKELLGDPSSIEELQARREQSAQIGEALANWRPSEREAQDLARIAQGLSGQVAIPGLGTFENQAEASITANMFMHGLDFSLRSRQVDAQDDFVGEFIGQMADEGVTISRPVAADLMSAVNSGEAEQLEGFLARFEDPETGELDPAVGLAARTYMRGKARYDVTMETLLGQFPEGELFLQLQGIGQLLEPIVGKEETERLMRTGIPQLLQRTGFPTQPSRGGAPLGIGRRSAFETIVGDVEEAEVRAGRRPAGQNIFQRAGRFLGDLFGAGPSDEQLRAPLEAEEAQRDFPQETQRMAAQQLETAVERLAAGQINLRDIRQTGQFTESQLRAIARAAERLREENR